ncbi:hypothetical protein CONCODRAFT_10291 [Conidiobolus coronatus NRRL 28638]|uniref:Homeobox domain-containing protein n=1 Tax=Conidiobolus coronatus (strain ATCC 28846 / CBS 209.66 / NRRL 28638) TaxID=796925 RepID=A0A137NY59_CONC2|nr:hypothetical protein CONCODRAFT_10291 [Conidiobolus coronatus NRRL 28638]|eukprot:KXN67601.1 hypothetical protein CONCODRAFT_10291 [Conidiobolus coronatus NRRL 28638]
MNFPHCPSHKQLDILKHVPFPCYTYGQQLNAPSSSEYLNCKLAPISSRRGHIVETLPSIKQMHILDTTDRKSIYCPYSPLSSSPSLMSNYSSSSLSSPMLSSSSGYHTLTNEYYTIPPHKIDYGNKIRFHVSKRTFISEEQTKILNDFYKISRYPTRSEKAILSKQLNLTLRTIRVWFQNRRQNKNFKR